MTKFVIRVEQQDIDKGRQGTAQECPVARAVYRAVPGVRQVFVTRDEITLRFKRGVEHVAQLTQDLWERVTLYDVERKMQPFNFNLELAL